ncbi:MAG: OmpA family protein [Rhodoblastus sp.]
MQDAKKRFLAGCSALAVAAITPAAAYGQDSPPATPGTPPAPQAAAPAPRRPLSQEEAVCQKQMVDELARNTIQFRTGSDEIRSESVTVIARLADVLKSCPKVKVEIAGHTDNVGEPESNKDLSLRRAQSVVRALETQGIAADRVSAAGYGEEQPVASNNTREGRAQNRRTEFVVK